jgi:pyruvate dehydrogenase E2 component (dihydrolipoamide acetyltransferase)
MALEFKLPDLGEGLAEGEIVQWLVKEGESIAEGQILVKVETDKAVIEIPSPRKGIVLKIGAAEGETVQVGRVIIIIGEAGEKLAAKPKAAEAKPRPSVGVVGDLEEAPEEEVKGQGQAEVKVTVEEEKKKEKAAVAGAAEILAVPMVRKLARDLGVDLAAVPGTGPKGRITREDVEKAARAKKTTPQEAPEIAVKDVRKQDSYGHVERVPLKGMRKTIAQSMVKSKSTIPHALGMDEADITELAALKAKAKERAAQKGIHLTFLPFIIKTALAALEEHPFVNASLDDESGEIILKKYYNIGVAVDTKDGLMVPVLKNAKGKNIFQIAKELGELSDRARARTIDLTDLKGGTFTITNYGAVGGTFAFPIIHHPEVAILGVGRILEKPVVRNGKIEVRKMLPLSVSFDHRVVDGAEATRFLNTVIELLQDPGLILMEE